MPFARPLSVDLPAGGGFLVIGLRQQRGFQHCKDLWLALQSYDLHVNAAMLRRHKHGSPNNASSSKPGLRTRSPDPKQLNHGNTLGNCWSRLWTAEK